MSWVVASPEYVAAAASDLANIGSGISTANAAALASTSSVIAPGADEVSVVISALFGAHAQAYQALSAQAALFHQQFVQLMGGGAAEYAAAEAANSSPLQTIEQAVTSAAPFGSAAAAVPAAVAGLSGSTPASAVAPVAGLTTSVTPASAVSPAVSGAVPGLAAPVTPPVAASPGAGPIYNQLVRDLGYEPLTSDAAVVPAGTPVEAIGAETTEVSAFSPASALPLAGTPLAASPTARAYTPATPAYSPAGAAADEQPAG